MHATTCTQMALGALLHLAPLPLPHGSYNYGPRAPLVRMGHAFGHLCLTRDNKADSSHHFGLGRAQAYFA